VVVSNHLTLATSPLEIEQTVAPADRWLDAEAGSAGSRRHDPRAVARPVRS